jgi:hypothetical protein
MRFCTGKDVPFKQDGVSFIYPSGWKVVYGKDQCIAIASTRSGLIFDYPMIATLYILHIGEKIVGIMKFSYVEDLDSCKSGFEKIKNSFSIESN